MADETWTDVDVDLVTAELPVDPDDGTMVIGWNSDGVPQWGAAGEVAEQILAALASAGRLVSPRWLPRGEPYATSSDGRMELHFVLRAWRPGRRHVSRGTADVVVITVVAVPFVVIRHRERVTSA